ncbi:hypothetical protein [Xanthomonas citri]|uniref:hypothetical protein n=1 Tax=Xanthomonas citri TaxID=346 RepID=UPI001188E522|nr:hypothetical protein [Xanthomonas citri]QDS20757.1 hypothetical protein FPL05_14340 [Xanthomonas citri pv. glycines]
MSALTLLFSPLRYLSAKNPTKKWWDWWIPILLAGTLVLASTYLPKPLALFGDKGLIDGVNELLQVLVGFYIASLAAVASLNSESLNQKVSQQPVHLVVGDELRSLTRRQLLSLMFSYLSFSSIALYTTGLLANLLLPNIKTAISKDYAWIAKTAFTGAYGFALSQMICITLITLYYLGERIHWQTPTALPLIQKASANDRPKDDG